jgi:predicted nucleotidyltransferase
MPVDLIPFGGVEKDGVIAWPPSRDEVLNVTGFKEALASAIRVQVDTDFIVPMVSLPGLTVLKLFAWADRKQETNKDADDLGRLLKNYGNAGNVDRLYGEDLSVLEDANFEFDVAGAHLLGRDVARIVTPESSERIATILKSEEQLERLVA